MDIATTLVLLVGFVSGVLVMLERTHRRSCPLSWSPSGATRSGDRDIARTLTDLRVRRLEQAPRTR